MRINGWQWLWLVASILWAVVILLLAGILQSDGDRPSRAPMWPCSWCGCGSCQSRRFMGSALASPGSAADFNSLKVAHFPDLACGSAPPSLPHSRPASVKEPLQVRSLMLASASTRARAKTASSIAGVSRPVKVFCWLGWNDAEHRAARRRTATLAPWPNAGRGRAPWPRPARTRQHRVEGQLAERDDDRDPRQRAPTPPRGTAGRRRSPPASACCRAARSARPPMMYASRQRQAIAPRCEWAGWRSRRRASPHQEQRPTDRR